VSSDSLAATADDELPASAKRVLSGLTGQQLDCQTGGSVHTPLTASWRGAQRESDKTRLFRYVRRESDGVPLSKVVRDVFGQDAVDAAGADYNLARRFFKRHDVFKTTRRGGNLWVQPTLEAFNSSQQYANDKTTGRDGDGLSNGANCGQTDCRSSASGDCRGQHSSADCPSVSTTASTTWQAQYPKDRAKSVLAKRLLLDGSDDRHDYRAELLRELGTELVVQSDKFKILRRVRGQGSEYLLIPYSTRFNTVSRAESIRDGFNSALATAAEDYSDAVVMTLTTDANRFSSLSAAMDGLTEAKGQLLSWLATDYQLGYRPENLTALEFTESGLPHVHLVLFGQSWALRQSALSAKWDDLGQGSIVDIRTARSRDGSGRWLLHNDDGSTVTLRQYLGKAIDGLCGLADMDAEDIKEAAESGESQLWRQALYWATERQYYSCSPSLRDTDDGDGLPFVKRYEFVSVAQYQDIPAQVRRNATVFVDRGRPPPDSGGQTTASRHSADG
jgi:hypothetical protein